MFLVPRNAVANFSCKRSVQLNDQHSLNLGKCECLGPASHLWECAYVHIQFTVASCLGIRFIVLEHCLLQLRLDDSKIPTEVDSVFQRLVVWPLARASNNKWHHLSAGKRYLASPAPSDPLESAKGGMLEVLCFE